MDEAVYTGWHLIGYRVREGRRSRYFCFVAPFEDRIGLGFEYGVLLTNDAGLLEGGGTQVRYVTIHRVEDIRESPRVWKWVRREKLLLMVTVLYTFLLSLLGEELEALRVACLRWGCHRTGKRSRKVAAPLYRLRAALSRLLAAYPRSLLAPTLNPG